MRWGVARGYQQGVRRLVTRAPILQKLGPWPAGLQAEEAADSVIPQKTHLPHTVRAGAVSQLHAACSSKPQRQSHDPDRTRGTGCRTSDWLIPVLLLLAAQRLARALPSVGRRR